MKIGILTFHQALNYGAVLQTYASVQFLRKLGYETYVLDYHCAWMEERYRPFHWDQSRWNNERWRYALKWLPTSLLRCRRASLFEKFRADYLPLLPFSQAGEMDSLLVGSDQVWNGVITGFDPVYSGATLPDVKKVAWAVSSGSQLLEEEDVKSLSAAFSAISVREPSLQPLFPGSEWLSDPTVLLSEEQWRTMTTPIRERYVLAFPMKNDEEVLRKARQIAQERHLPLKILSQRASLQFDRIQLAGPKEFLSLIASAEYVVTSSYHGAIFSKIFSKEHSWICEPSDPRFQALEKLDFNEAQSRAADFLKRALG